MQAIEFETTLHNSIVTLPPEQAAQWEGQSVRVIVLKPADAPTLSVTPKMTNRHCRSSARMLT